jgi:thiamine biosynthesis lipoprotein ApbE
MATTFDVIIWHADIDATYAAQAAQRRVSRKSHRLEAELSRFRSPAATSTASASSRLARASSSAWPRGTASRSPKPCIRIDRGAFDITIGPLMSLFVMNAGEPRQVSKDVLDQARQIIGSHRFDLDEETMRVTVQCREA